MKKLNIAIVCDSVTNPIGGSFVSAVRFAKLLSKRGHKIIFITARHLNRPLVDNKYGIKTYRLPSLKVPNSQGPFYVSIPSKKRIIKILNDEKIEILHTIMPSVSSIQSIYAARKLGIKIVAHSHVQPENILVNLPKILAGQNIKKYFYKYLGWIYKKADIVLFPSKLAEKRLKSTSRKINTFVISNGVDRAIFKKLKYDSFLKKYNLNQRELRILFVGRLHPEKNIKVLIDSILPLSKKFSNFHLDIIGEGHLRKDLEKHAHELGVEKKITFFGNVSEKDLILAYCACDIFVLPSLVELEGMVVLEAMSCGKPIVIANSVESASVYFVKGNGFLFNHKDPNDLSKKLLKLLNDPVLRKKMGKKSLELSKEYDINKSIDKLEFIYYRLLKNRQI